MFDFRGNIEKLSNEMKKPYEEETDRVLKKLYDYLKVHPEELLHGKMKFLYYKGSITVWYLDASEVEVNPRNIIFEKKYPFSNEARLVFLIIRDYFKSQIIDEESKEDSDSFCIKIY